MEYKFNLDNLTWAQFKLGDLFSIESCKCAKVSGMNEGSTPYVGATSKNNGIINFVESQKELITKGNCIAFICDGDGSIGLSIYKQEDFIGSTTVKVGRNKYLNKYIGLFITTIADTVRNKYSFGFKRNEKHLKNEILTLPKQKNSNQPDYVFMEKFIREKYNNRKRIYKDNLRKKIAKITVGNISPLSNKSWGEFYLTDIFSDIQRGKRLTKAHQLDGKIPYISSTSLNNGIDNFISNKKNVRMFDNCLTIANSGSVGATFFHPYLFIASDHVTHLKNENMNEYIYLFLATMTNKIAVKYNFNREINDKRIKKERIMLPIQKNGSPDYLYMENYIKQIIVNKYNHYINY